MHTAKRAGGAIALIALATACAAPGGDEMSRVPGPYAVVLGVAQDGGAPHAGCRRECCRRRWGDPALRRHASCLALVDPRTGRRWMIDATPDFREQLHALDRIAPSEAAPGLDGILLSHAHVGHYLGLAQLGREIMGTRAVPVYAMPRMRELLETSGPWSQLVSLGNIELRALEEGRSVQLEEDIAVTPFRVPHRDEYSETIGFLIRGPRHTLAWISDIDKWERWEKPIEELLAEVDAAWLDGTFYDEGEIPGRSMAEIPHPFIVESMARLAPLPASERAKVRFVHLNHTNPALEVDGRAAREIRAAGFALAQEGERLEL